MKFLLFLTVLITLSLSDHWGRGGKDFGGTLARIGTMRERTSCSNTQHHANEEVTVTVAAGAYVGRTKSGKATLNLFSPVWVGR